ncbi:hypothetical protein Q1695_001218 [Nippostrongylus brasiliensis]|nr:hypothetical protein Q1695_001218 [Nippostrongylus brasiliensis]
MDEVVRAVDAIYNPLTTNADRVKCTQAIEAFKEGPADVVANTSFALISQNSLIHRHTGWSLLEDLIRYKWNSLPSELCLELRNRVFQAVDTLEQEDTMEPCARCVVAMMEHEWPQNWPELNSQLKDMCSRSPLHCAFVFAIERRLVENVRTLASIANPRRRRDMNSAIVDCMNDFITLALDTLDACHLDQSNVLAVKNILGWLTELCSCVSSGPLEDQLTRMVNILVRYLSTADGNIYEKAAQCLATLSARNREKTTHDTSTVISAFFREEVFTAILTVTSLAADGSQSSEQHYNFLKSLCEVLTTLGSFLSRVWTEKTPPANFGTYLSAIVAFFNHESLFLKLEACDVLLALSTHGTLRKDENLAQALRMVFPTALGAITKHGYPSENPPTTASQFANMDFDDDLEWHNCFSRFRMRVQLLFSENLEDHFSYLVSIFDELVLQRVLKDPYTVTEAEWEGMCKFAKNAITTAYERNIVGSEKDRLNAMRDTLVNLAMKVTDFTVMSEVFSLHSRFLLSYENDWTNLANYFALLKKTLVVSAGHKLLNRHVISLVLRAVQSFPLYFKQHVEDVVSLYSDVDGVISQMQMAQLLQVLAVLSNVIEDDPTRMKLLQMATGPCIEYLRSVDWTFENVSVFIKSYSFDIAPTDSAEQTSRSRIELRRALTCIQGIIQQVTAPSPLGAMLIPIFPTILRLTRCLLDLHTDESLKSMHPLSAESVIKMMASERQRIYCSVGENIEFLTGRPAVLESEVCVIQRQFVQDMNEHMNTILVALTSKFPEEFYSIGNLPLLLNGIVANIEAIPDFRVRFWNKKAWKSLVCDCPPAYWPSIKGFFERIVMHMHSRLDRKWAEISHVDYDSEPTEEELFNEHLTCVLSRDYVVFLKFCYLANDVEEKKSLAMSALGEWLFENKIGLSPVIMTSFASLAFRDSNLAQKSLCLCKVLVEKLMHCYDDEVGVYMLVCSIRSLQVHGADEVAGSPLFGLLFHIYFCLRRFSMSFPQVLLQIPNVAPVAVEEFDNKVRAIISGDEVIFEKQKKDLARKLLKGAITLTVGEQHKKPVYLRPLPPIEKRRRMEDESDDNFGDIALLFAHKE